MTEDKAVHEPQGSKAIAAAGALVLLAALGPVLDSLWLALLPAATALAFGASRIGRDAASRRHRPLQVAAAAVSSFSALLVFLAAAGFVFQWTIRTEPEWLAATAMWAGLLFLGSVIVFGLAGRASGFLPRRPSLLLALSLPLGFGIDAVFGQIPHFFLQGAGLSAGLGLLGLSLILVSRTRKVPAPKTSPITTTPAAHPAG